MIFFFGLKQYLYMLTVGESQFYYCLNHNKEYFVSKKITRNACMQLQCFSLESRSPAHETVLKIKQLVRLQEFPGFTLFHHTIVISFEEG